MVVLHIPTQYIFLKQICFPMFCVFSALQSRNSGEVCAALQPGGRASGRWDVRSQLSRPSRHGGGLHQRGTRVQRLPVPGLLPLPLSVQAGSEQSVKHAVTILTDAQLESFHCGFQTNRSRSNQHKNTYQILPYCMTKHSPFILSHSLYLDLTDACFLFH